MNDEQAMEPDRLRWILYKADTGDCTSLSSWEEELLSDMEDRLDKYGDDIFISERQAEALERITEKLA